MTDQIDVVRRWLDGFNARDDAQMVAVAHPDIVLRPLRWGVSSEYHGHEGVRAWMAAIRATPHASTLSVKEIRPVAAGVLAQGTVDGDGTPFVALYELRDGLIADVRAYLSDPELLEQLGRLG